MQIMSERHQLSFALYWKGCDWESAGVLVQLMPEGGQMSRFWVKATPGCGNASIPSPPCRTCPQAVRDSIPLFGVQQSISINDSVALDRLSLDDIAPFSRKKVARGHKHQQLRRRAGGEGLAYLLLIQAGAAAFTSNAW